jgi:chromate transporter
VLRKREDAVSSPSAPIDLTAHLALVSSISFGGFPTVLPDVRNFVVATHRWMTDQEFADFFAIAQSIPGPNMILMMSFVGWKVWGFPGAVASAFATFGPPCAMYFTGYRLWDRFRAAPWQRIVRLGLVPVTMGIVIASGVVMARAADTGWPSAVLTIAAAAVMLATRLNPMWMLLTGAALGGLGLL